jgi:hypothetical protein
MDNLTGGRFPQPIKAGSGPDMGWLFEKIKMLTMSMSLFFVRRLSREDKFMYQPLKLPRLEEEALGRTHHQRSDERLRTLIPLRSESA